MKPPPGFVEHVSGDVMIVARAESLAFAQQAVAAAGSLHAFAQRSTDALQREGRGAAYAIRAGDTQWLVRHYVRGGTVASLLGDRYMRTGSPRPIAELIVSEAARARGIATPRVMSGIVYTDGMFYRGDIATEYHPAAADLAVLTLGPAPWEPDARVAAWRGAGALLRMCFENGLSHPDLNLKNIIVEQRDGGVNAYVIDLDKAHLRDRTTESQRDAMLARFERSRHKLERKFARVTGNDELRAFHEGLGS